MKEKENIVRVQEDSREILTNIEGIEGSTIDNWLSIEVSTITADLQHLIEAMTGLKFKKADLVEKAENEEPKLTAWFEEPEEECSLTTCQQPAHAVIGKNGREVCEEHYRSWQDSEWGFKYDDSGGVRGEGVE